MLIMILTILATGLLRYLVMAPVTERLYAPSKAYRRWRPIKAQPVIPAPYLARGKVYRVVKGVR